MKVGLDTAGGRGSAAAEPAAGMRSGWRATEGRLVSARKCESTLMAG